MNNYSDSDDSVNKNALRIYPQNDSLDDFPVLKAFQQYIDAEQNKARKRMLGLCGVFGVLIMILISVFLIILRDAHHRNQTLSDRLLDYAMKERDAGKAAVVVQQPSSDNSGLVELTKKFEALQKQLFESEKKKAQIEIEEQTKKTEEKKLEEAKAIENKNLEIERLKAQLAEQKAKAAEETQLRKAAELEAYRRKHYPELYEPVESQKRENSKEIKTEEKALEKKITAPEDVNEETAINYFLNEEDIPAGEEPVNSKNTKSYSIPVEVKGSSSTWRIPNL